MTEPAGAVCELRRDGAVISVVNPSPGTVYVEKIVRDIGVNCTAPGHHPGAAVISAQFQPMAVGNLLIGGLVGLVVDSASGAIAEYPGVVQMQLTPTRGTQQAMLQDHYLRRAAEIARRNEQDISAIRPTCRAGERALCNSQVAEIRSRGRLALELNERDRLRQHSGT